MNVDIQEKKLGDLLVKIVGGGTPSKEVSSFWNGDIPWAAVKDFKGNILEETIDAITEEGLKNSSANLVPAWTLIVPTRMALGKAAFFKLDVAINQDLKALYPKNNLDKFFLFYWFQLNADKILRLGSGSTVKGIRLEVLRELDIALPPLPEQQKIAEILSTVDAKIEVIDQQIAKTQELKKGLMKQLLTGRLSVVENRLLSDAEMIDSPLGKIPRSWELVKIDNIANVRAGGTPSTKEPSYWGGDIPWMNSGEINLRRIREVEGRITEIGLNNSSTKLIPEKSVLMALAGQGKTRGKVAINEFSLCTNQSLATIYDFKNADYEFIFQNLESRYFEIRKMSTGDGGRGGLNLAIIKSIPIALPPLREQQKIAKILTSLDDKLEVLGEKKIHYQELKQGIMQQLLTGKVRVNSLLEKTIKA